MLCLSLQKENGQPPVILWERVTMLPGEHLTLSIGEYPNEEDASILSQILQTDAPEKYYLSQKACQGILRRAADRGKELPMLLKKALERQAAIA